MTYKSVILNKKIKWTNVIQSMHYEKVHNFFLSIRISMSLEIEKKINKIAKIIIERYSSNIVQKLCANVSILSRLYFKYTSQNHTVSWGSNHDHTWNKLKTDDWYDWTWICFEWKARLFFSMTSSYYYCYYWERR